MSEKSKNLNKKKNLRATDNIHLRSHCEATKLFKEIMGKVLEEADKRDILDVDIVENLIVEAVALGKAISHDQGKLIEGKNYRSWLEDLLDEYITSVEEKGKGSNVNRIPPYAANP